MIRHLDLEISELKEKLLTMGSHSERAVSDAVKSLINRDDSLARIVQENDNVIDHFEITVDEMSIHLLSKAPLATDLRFITAAMKISQNLERIGDEACKIARRSLELNAEPPLKPYVDIPRMAQIALEMLKVCLDGFVNKQPEKALEIIKRDKEVDGINKQLHRELSSFMIENPNTITRCLNLMVVSKAIERIADHATNIAEEVVYVYEARDIRHGGGK